MDKIKEFFEDRERLTLIIVIIVTCLSIAVGVVVFIHAEDNPKPTDTKQTTTTKQTSNDKIFKGYKKYSLEEKTIKYDLVSRYKFEYSSNSRDSIMIGDDIEAYMYDLSLDNGILIFKEHKIVWLDDGNSKLVSTNKKYEFKTTKQITNYVLGTTCDAFTYEITLVDEEGTVYNYVNNQEQYSDDITSLINSIKKVKTISPAKKIGYYGLNNSPNVTCNGYQMIYVDKNNNIRYLNNKLFFNDAYYRFIGADFNDVVYILNDGTMVFDYYADKYAKLRNKDEIIKYRGSFYTMDDKTNKEDLYIIGTDLYLYKIPSLSSESSVLLKRVSEEKIKNIGTQSQKNSDGFVTDEKRLIVEFSDGEVFKLDTIKEFELLN